MRSLLPTNRRQFLNYHFSLWPMTSDDFTVLIVLIKPERCGPWTYVFNFCDVTFDLWFGAQFHFSHCIQCKIVWAPPPKFVELLQKNLYQKIACFKYFQYLWTIWPWPHSQGHRSHIYVSKCNLKTWHVFSLLGLESLYHSVRDIYYRSTCYTKPRSVWPL